MNQMLRLNAFFLRLFMSHPQHTSGKLRLKTGRLNPRRNHGNIHVRAYNEEGTTAAAFDMVVLNNLDRYQLAPDATRSIPRLGDQIEEASTR